MSPDIWLRHGFVCAPPPMARVSSYSIPMHLHHYRFQPAAIPTVLLVLAVPLFLALGQWQLVLTLQQITLDLREWFL